MAVLRPSLMRLWLGAALVLTPPAVLAQAPSAPASPGGAAPAVVAEPSTKGAPAAAVQAASEEAPAAKAGPAPEEPALKAERSATDRELVENWQDPTLEMAEEAEPESLGWTLMRTLLVLGAVVASIYLTLNVGLRRLMGLQAVASGRQPLVTVVERLPLDQRRSLFVVKAAGEYLLVGGGEAGLQLLSKLDSEAVERIRSERPPTNVVPLSPFLQKLLSRRSGGSPSQPPGA